MMLLVASVFAAADPHAFGLTSFPEAPRDTRVEVRRHRERLRARPSVLVPLGAQRAGWASTWDRWQDERGTVYTLAEVETILLADPASAALVRRARTRRIVGIAVGAAGTIGAVGCVVATGGAAAVVLPAAAMLVGQHGYGLAFWGMYEERAAVKAYNLAHGSIAEGLTEVADGG